MHLQEAVLESRSPSVRAGTARALVLARAAIAAVGFCSSVIVGLQAWSTWTHWSRAMPVRLEVAALSTLAQIHWAVAEPLIGEPAVTEPEPTRQNLTEASPKAAPSVASSVTTRKKRPVTLSARQHRQPAAVGPAAKNLATLTAHQLLLQITLNHRASFAATLASLDSQPTVSQQRVLVAEVKAPQTERRTRPDPAVSARKPRTHPAPLNARATLAPALAIVSESAAIQPPGYVKPQFRAWMPEPVVAEAEAVVATQVPPKFETPSVDRIRNQASAPMPVAESRNTTKALTRGMSGSANWVVEDGAGMTSVLYSQMNIQKPQALRAEWVNTQVAPSGDRQQPSGGVSTSSALGSVSGWISNLETVRVLGVRGEVKYFTASGEPTQAREPGDKFFIITSVRPGAAVVQAVAGSGVVRQAAGLPVVAGSTTQVDFRKFSSHQVRGSLLSADSREQRPIARAEVRIVGMPDQVRVTSTTGEFDFGTISVPAGLPLYVEARLPQGFTHRYALTARSLEAPVVLYRFSDERIQGWVSSLEGGISAESGIVVGLAPARMAASTFPVVKPMARESSITPETYWLGKSDELLEPSAKFAATQSLQPWIGVEVPAGAALVGLQSARGRWLSADWFPVSPGVVGVLSTAE